jgi:hypothetical protein
VGVVGVAGTSSDFGHGVSHHEQEIRGEEIVEER